MFELDPSRTHIEARPEEVLDVYNAINRANVAIPDRAPESSQAFIASVYQDGFYHVYIYLYLTVSNDGMLYVWSDGGVPGDRLNDIYSASFEFTEAMGFMMDTMHYREKSPEEKEAIFAEIPLFHADLAKFKSGEEKSEELLIEEIAETTDGVQLEPVEEDEEEEEEINLNMLTETEDATPAEPVADVELSTAEPVAEEEIALGSLEESAQPEEEDVLLNSIDAQPAVAVAEEDAALDGLIGEDTVEAPASPDLVAEVEISLTPEEAQVFAVAEPVPADPIEAAPIKPPAPKPAPPKPKPAPAPVKPRPAAPAPVAAGPGGALSSEEYQSLVSLLAMF